MLPGRLQMHILLTKRRSKVETQTPTKVGEKQLFGGWKSLRSELRRVNTKIMLRRTRAGVCGGR